LVFETIRHCDIIESNAFFSAIKVFRATCTQSRYFSNTPRMLKVSEKVYYFMSQLYSKNAWCRASKFSLNEHSKICYWNFLKFENDLWTAKYVKRKKLMSGTQFDKVCFVKKFVKIQQIFNQLPALNKTWIGLHQRWL